MLVDFRGGGGGASEEKKKREDLYLVSCWALPSIPPIHIHISIYLYLYICIYICFKKRKFLIYIVAITNLEVYPGQLSQVKGDEVFCVLGVAVLMSSPVVLKTSTTH